METWQKVGIGGAAALLLFAVLKKKPVATTTTKPKKMDAKTFYNKFYADALASEKVTGVPALSTLAQAAVESRYGEAAPGNNYFGIKANSAWKGAVQLLLTWECGATGNAKKDGITDQIVNIFPPGTPNAPCKNKYSYRVRAPFRKYATPAESFIDHGLFLKNNKRYAEAFKTKEVNKFIDAIAKAGYATAPDYAMVLKNTVKNFTA